MKSTHIKKILLTLIAFTLLPSALFAANFGLALNAGAGYGNAETGENSFDYQIDILPRFSMLIGDNGEFEMSAGFTFGMEYDEFYYVPELLQTVLTMRFGNSGIRVGRFNYSAPLPFVTDGLFDGFQFFYNSDIGNFHIGAWYTGFMYKNNTNILMTDNDRDIYSTFVDYGDFLNTYFAPKRALASIGWEHLSVGEFVHLNAELIGQFDLTEENEKYHSQYLILKAGIPVKNFFLELGGSLEIYQTSDESNIALAGEFGLYWQFSQKFNSRLSLTGRIASGVIENSCGAFVPITTKYYGYIFQHTLSGLSVFTLNYSGRLTKALGVSITAAYFVRSDLGTYNGYPVSKDGYFLGPDFSAKIIWSPASDLQFNLIGGAFVPALGDAGSEEKLRWCVELTATIALF
ncbi:MAG: hypothetical protein LBI28_12115 [Treponema sp.]|jgi:hypothetical protein|nr:hypothetical protein [Treponema sp.]